MSSPALFFAMMVMLIASHDVSAMKNQLSSRSKHREVTGIKLNVGVGSILADRFLVTEQLYAKDLSFVEVSESASMSTEDPRSFATNFENDKSPASKTLRTLGEGGNFNSVYDMGNLQMITSI